MLLIKVEQKWSLFVLLTAYNSLNTDHKRNKETKKGKA